MNKATIVSALFNIEREVMDGRPWEEYLKWFDIFLKLKTPMVLFVTEDLVEFVTERRKGMQYVKENHTYINRATSLLKVFEEVS